jgi:hypothetical protein
MTIQKHTLPEGFDLDALLTSEDPKMRLKGQLVETYMSAMDELSENYADKDPAEYTTEAVALTVKEVNEANGTDITVNSVRIQLNQLKVYLKKSAVTTPSAGASAPKTGGRVSKADAQAALKEAITATGGEVDEEIISKLTGKAAQYFAQIFAQVSQD